MVREHRSAAATQRSGGGADCPTVLDPARDEPRGKVQRILVVCTGNICRSPLAEALLQRGLVARRRRDVWVESAGTAGFRGLPAAQGSIDYARSIGLDLSAHRSAPLVPEKINESDLILCLEEHHRDAVLRMAPAAAPRTFLLSHFLPPPLGDSEIPDPHGGTRAEYRSSGERVVEACRAVMDHLAASGADERRTEER